jgi:hypothetical protein
VCFEHHQALSKNGIKMSEFDGILSNYKIYDFKDLDCLKVNTFPSRNEHFSFEKQPLKMNRQKSYRRGILDFVLIYNMTYLPLSVDVDL